MAGEKWREMTPKEKETYINAAKKHLKKKPRSMCRRSSDKGNEAVEDTNVMPSVEEGGK